MKKTIYILLILLCVFAFASCENKVPTVGKYNVPLWLAGKTWSGTVTLTVSDVTMERTIEYTFDKDGNPVGIGDISEGVVITGSNNGDAYTITLVGIYVDEDTEISENFVYIFTKVSDSECKFKCTGPTSIGGVSLTAEMEGILKVKE